MDPEFYAFVRYLKKHFPDPKGKPVHVRTRKMTDLFGSCNKNYYRTNIVINNRQDHNFAIDTLIHEWAHMLDDKGMKDNIKEEHRQSWGRIYAKLYQAYWKFLKDYNEYGFAD